MATKLNDDFMRSIVNDEAWKSLAGNFKWTEALLEKYQNDVNWDEISENTNIQWTIPMLQKFSNRINWSKFSEYANEDTLTPMVIEIFKDRWDWHELSHNHDLKLTDDFLMKYAESLDWEHIIGRWREDVFEGRGMDFFEKFKEYIPAAKLQDSALWEEIIAQRKQELIKEIIS